MNQKNSVRKLPFSFAFLVLSASSRENDDSRELFLNEIKALFVFVYASSSSSLLVSRFLNETMFMNEYTLKRSSKCGCSRARVSKQSRR